MSKLSAVERSSLGKRVFRLQIAEQLYQARGHMTDFGQMNGAQSREDVFSLDGKRQRLAALVGRIGLPRHIACPHEPLDEFGSGVPGNDEALGQDPDCHGHFAAMAFDGQQGLVLLTGEPLLLRCGRREVHKTTQDVAQVSQRLVVGIRKCVLFLGHRL